jgi:hypothetical protein
MSASHPPKLSGTPDLIFPWRGRKHPFVPKFLAVAFAATFFAVLLSVRVRVRIPENVLPAKASVMFLDASGVGRSLALRAREGGPFPARFRLSEWPGVAVAEAAGIEAVRYRLPAYQPVVPELPHANELASLPLASRGKSYFPVHPPVARPVPDTAGLALAPVLYPLDGVTRAQLPTVLPPFDAALVPAVSADPNKPYRRFLLHLNASGSVAECTPLEAGMPEAAAWLRKLQFAADPAQPERWLAVGLGFTNQPAHEPVAH